MARPILLTRDQVRTARDLKAATFAFLPANAFLKLTTPSQRDIEIIQNEALPYERYVEFANTDEIRVPAFLKIDIETGKVIGHEGRHRIAAKMNHDGDATPVPVAIIPAKDGYAQRDKTQADLPPVWEGQFRPTRFNTNAVVAWRTPAEMIETLEAGGFKGATMEPRFLERWGERLEQASRFMDYSDALDRDKVRQRVYQDTQNLKVAQIRQLAKHYGAKKVPTSRLKATHALTDAYMAQQQGTTLGRAPRLWWKGPIPRTKACYPTKQALLRLFVDENRNIIENYGGIDYQVSPAEFDAINHKYDLTGKEAARSIADAVWAALPPQPRKKYCFEDIDLEALNDTSPAREAGISFRLPDELVEQQLVAQEAQWYREQYGSGARPMLGIEPYQAKKLTDRFRQDWYKVLRALDYSQSRSIAAVAKRAGISKKRAETIMDEMVGWEMAEEVQRGRSWQYKLTDEGGEQIMRRRGDLGSTYPRPRRKRCLKRLDDCLQKANTSAAERKCYRRFEKCKRRRK
jgi:predicted transcriptional regulator